MLARCEALYGWACRWVGNRLNYIEDAGEMLASGEIFRFRGANHLLVDVASAEFSDSEASRQLESALNGQLHKLGKERRITCNTTLL